MKEFVNEVSRTLKIDRRDPVEKDFVLHRMLLDLSKDEKEFRMFLREFASFMQNIAVKMGY